MARLSPRDHSGNSESFDDFFLRILSRAIRAARRLRGDPWTAEDVAVEALARAHARWTRVGPLEWRDAWVLKIASREALHQVRRRPPLLCPTTTKTSRTTSCCESPLSLFSSACRAANATRSSYVVCVSCPRDRLPLPSACQQGREDPSAQSPRSPSHGHRYRLRGGSCP
jgi:hypothetical protein